MVLTLSPLSLSPHVRLGWHMCGPLIILDKGLWTLECPRITCSHNFLHREFWLMCRKCLSISSFIQVLFYIKYDLVLHIQILIGRPESYLFFNRKILFFIFNYQTIHIGWITADLWHHKECHYNWSIILTLINYLNIYLIWKFCENFYASPYFHNQIFFLMCPVN